MEFVKFDKIPRLNRDCIVTEKIDGTNAQIVFTEDGEMLVGSRKRWIVPGDDNYGFAKWAHENRDDLFEALGFGTHFGEWWGQGIQRGYGMDRKVFSLFNTTRWKDVPLPDGVDVVPVMYEGKFTTYHVRACLMDLRDEGSVASSGFMQPEGVVVFHVASQHLYKATLLNDEKHKGESHE